MDSELQEKLVTWIFQSILLLSAFFIGLSIPMFGKTVGPIIGFIIMPVLIILIMVLLHLFVKNPRIEEIKKEKLLIWIYFALNLVLAFFIGLAIPGMESISKYNLAYVMLPLLIILNYVITDRLFFYLDTTTERKEENLNEKQD